MEFYNKKFKEFEKEQDRDDNEFEHMIQDEIYRKFINDIANGKFKTLNDVKTNKKKNS